MGWFLRKLSNHTLNSLGFVSVPVLLRWLTRRVGPNREIAVPQLCSGQSLPVGQDIRGRLPKLDTTHVDSSHFEKADEWEEDASTQKNAAEHISRAENL